MDFDALYALLMKEWGSLTMEALRQQSLDAPGGVAFTSLCANGRRVMLVACATDPDLLARLQVTPDTRNKCWTNVFISALVVRFRDAERATVHVLLDSNNEISALGLIAATPDSTEKLGQLFVLPD